MLARRLTTIQQHVEFVASGLCPGAGGAGGDAELPPVLLRRIRRHPETTVISINAINRRIWVRHIMEVRYGFHFMHFLLDNAEVLVLRDRLGRHLVGLNMRRSTSLRVLGFACLTRGLVR
jgi:hypothetical protein